MTIREWGRRSKLPPLPKEWKTFPFEPKRACGFSISTHILSNMLQRRKCQKNRRRERRRRRGERRKQNSFRLWRLRAPLVLRLRIFPLGNSSLLDRFKEGDRWKDPIYQSISISRFLHYHFHTVTRRILSRNGHTLCAARNSVLTTRKLLWVALFENDFSFFFELDLKLLWLQLNFQFKGLKHSRWANCLPLVLSNLPPSSHCIIIVDWSGEKLIRKVGKGAHPFFLDCF